VNTVPIGWFIAVGSALISGFVWWVKREFALNDLYHDKAEKELHGTNKRIDHLILNLLPGKPYKDE